MIREIEKDICLNAGYLIANDQIIINDSRFLINVIIPKLAKEFKSYYSNKEEYSLFIDEFSFNKLIELFGID